MQAKLVSSISAALVIAALAGCGGSSVAPTASVPTDRYSLTNGQSTLANTVDDGPTAEDALAWVTSTIAAGGALTAADVDAHFAPGFLKEMPPAKVIEIFAMLAQQLPPMKQLKVEGKPPLTLSALLDTASGGVRVTVTMSASTPRKISGLIFAPAPGEAPPRTYGDAVAQLQQAGAKTQLVIAELDDHGACKPYQNHNPLAELAVGSTAKLWVLLALDEKLRTDKKVTWATELAVRDEAKSLPSGELQDLAAGTKVAVRDVAATMIALSDNTATDHLIDLVGREAVEKALALARHADPKLDTPFLRTRELFALKLAVAPDELAVYRKAPLAAKKKLLEGFRQRPLDLTKAVQEWTAPRQLDLQWFASGPDLCNVMGTLAARAGWKPDGELLAILGQNPGVAFDHDRWKYLGFKGGHEPGVMNLTWLGQRADGKWFVVAATVNDEQHALDEALVTNAASGALAILGNETAAPAPAAP